MTATMVVPLKLTREQFGSLPEPEHGGKMELVDGRLVARGRTMAPVGPEHGKRANRIGRFLDVFAEENDLGSVRQETGYWLSKSTSRAPDVSFVSKEREATEVVVHGSVNQPPDLAIEVVSPGDSEREIAAKVRMYLASGVSRAWVVRPVDRSVTVHWPDGTAKTFGEADVLTSGEAGFAVAGLEIPVARIFS